MKMPDLTVIMQAMNKKLLGGLLPALLNAHVAVHDVCSIVSQACARRRASRRAERGHSGGIEGPGAQRQSQVVAVPVAVFVWPSNRSLLILARKRSCLFIRLSVHGMFASRTACILSKPSTSLLPQLGMVAPSDLH